MDRLVPLAGPEQRRSLQVSANNGSSQARVPYTPSLSDSQSSPVFFASPESPRTLSARPPPAPNSQSQICSDSRSWGTQSSPDQRVPFTPTSSVEDSAGEGGTAHSFEVIVLDSAESLENHVGSPQATSTREFPPASHIGRNMRSRENRTLHRFYGAVIDLTNDSQDEEEQEEEEDEAIVISDGSD